MQKLSPGLIYFLVIFISFVMFSCMPRVKETTPQLNIPLVKIHLKTVTNNDTIRFNGMYFLDTEEARYEFGNSNKQVFITLINDGYKVYNDNRLFLFRKMDKIKFVPQDPSSVFSVNNNEYQGDLGIMTADSNTLYLVNEIDLENYLKGVVPAEIFTDNDTLIDAVKAQAICARTYSLKKMSVNKDKPFHMFSDVRDQVYRGASVRTTLGDFAVDETQGSILVYSKEIADIYFHASCGGILEAAENVWLGQRVPYLSEAQDVIGREFADIESPFFRWTQNRTAGQLDTLFQYSFGISHLADIVQDTMDIPLSVKVRERYDSGRVKKVSLYYGTEQRELSGYEIRRFFGWPPGTLLPSTLIKFLSTGSRLIIEGAGNGHGVGLCQYGAMYKAKKGLQYYHILQSYFPGTTLKEIY